MCKNIIVNSNNKKHMFEKHLNELIFLNLVSNIFPPKTNK